MGILKEHYPLLAHFFPDDQALRKDVSEVNNTARYQLSDQEERLQGQVDEFTKQGIGVGKLEAHVGMGMIGCPPPITLKVKEKDNSLPEKDCPVCNYPLGQHGDGLGIPNDYIPCEYCWLKNEVAKRKPIYRAYIDEVPTLSLDDHEICEPGELTSEEIVAMWDKLKSMYENLIKEKDMAKNTAPETKTLNQQAFDLLVKMEQMSETFTAEVAEVGIAVRNSVEPDAQVLSAHALERSVDLVGDKKIAIVIRAEDEHKDYHFYFTKRKDAISFLIDMKGKMKGEDAFWKDAAHKIVQSH